MPLGIPELLIILVIVLVVFGPKRLPMLGRQLGGGMREFKDSITKKHEADDEDDEAATVATSELEPGDPLNPVADPTRTPTGARDESATRAGRDPS